MVAGLAAVLLLTSCATPPSSEMPSAELDEHLQALAGFDYGQGRDPVVAFSRYLTTHAGAKQRSAMETQLLAFAVDETAPRAARQYVIREVGRVGSAKSAPVLAGLLGDESLGDDAAMALQRLGGSKVSNQILAVLPDLDGEARLQAIATLGELGEVRAVRALATVAGGDDEAAAVAAVTALGRIASPKAAEALIELLPGLKGRALQAAWPGLIAGQEAAVGAGRDKTVQAIVSALAENQAPAHTVAASRLASLRGAPAEAQLPGLLALLEASDGYAQAAGATYLRTSEGTDLSVAVSRVLPDLPVASQVAVLRILGDGRVIEAAPGMAERVSSSEESVRISALIALGEAGEAESVGIIVGALHDESDPVAKAAREALNRIAGPGIDKTLLDLAQTAETPLRVAILAALGDRGTAGAVPVLFACLADTDPAVRKAAARPLGALAESEDYPRILTLITETPEKADRQPLMAAAIAAGKGLPVAGDAVAEALAEPLSPEARTDLLILAGQLGAEPALAALVEASTAEDETIRTAALRGLSNWTSPTAIPALIAAASEADEGASRLAARGAIQVARQAEGLTAADRVGFFQDIAGQVSRPEDLRLLLSAVADTGSPEAFGLAARFLENADVRSEAEAAMIRIAKQAPALDETIRRGLRQIAAESAADGVKSEAEALLQ